MQLQEYGPDRRVLMNLVAEAANQSRVEREKAAIHVCDRLTIRKGYKNELAEFTQIDRRILALWDRWDQLNKGVSNGKV